MNKLNINMAAVSKRAIDETGNKYNMLTAISVDRRTSRGQIIWKCVCDCGNTTEVEGSHLRLGQTKSCGCLRGGVVKHGMSGSVEWLTWRNIRERCHNKLANGYQAYGAIGIKVCDRWRYSFKNFYEDMGKRPEDCSSIDRRDNGGDYTPENCRWSNATEQSRNRCSTKLNNVAVSVIKYLVDNDGRSFAEIARAYRMSGAAISNAYKGKTWAVGMAVLSVEGDNVK